MLRRVFCWALCVFPIAGCTDKARQTIGAGWGKGARHAPRPDSLPVMLNLEPPFHYPRDLYARKVQGNVTLRIFIDAEGRVRPESTTVAEPSGYAALDSAAVAGTQELRFRPAMLKGEAIAVSILFPVYFRHPEGAALPGDSVLKRGIGNRE